MRFLRLLAVLTLAAVGAVSAESQRRSGPAAPNTLTQQEVEGGWILLFDGSTTYGWLPSGDAGQRNTQDGALVLGPSRGGLRTTTEFGDFDLRCDVSDATGQGDAIAFSRDARIPLHAAAGRWKTISVHKVGRRVVWDGGGTAGIAELPAGGERCAVEIVAGGNDALRVRNVKLRPLGLQPLFNGKDLTGWSVVPGHASVFTVTPQGWLNIKNGNGDIQSDREFGDFVLQVDVFSNGDHLNSGIFFRANKGLFWSGYEDQIRNQWEGDDRNKAVDYGTGGVYNRLPARKVVSSDREWFTMTLVAHGKHIGSWVNGYMVADFTDNRPENQANARAGARTRPGVISLQGHDPTTDLSFRNIRAVELPPASGR